jgi:hypothetical protein
MTEAYWKPKLAAINAEKGIGSQIGRRCCFREGAQWQLGCGGGGSGSGFGVGASFFCAIADP